MYFMLGFQQCRKPAIFRWFYTSHLNDKSLGVDPQVLCCAGWSTKATPSVPKWVCPLDLPWMSCWVSNRVRPVLLVKPSKKG